MSIGLKTWCTLRDVSTSSEELVLRLLPDHFVRDEKPVLVIAISHPSDRLAASGLLQRFGDDFVVDVSVTDEVLELWAECDVEPTRIGGAEIRHQWSAYAAQELLQIASSFEDRLGAADAEVVGFRRHKADLEHFILELLRRAEARRNQSSVSTTASEAQIDVLQRVLNQLKSP